MPHRPDTPMVDVRDCAAAHIAAAEVAEAAGHRFITSSDRAMTRAHVPRPATYGCSECLHIYRCLLTHSLPAWFCY